MKHKRFSDEKIIVRNIGMGSGAGFRPAADHGPLPGQRARPAGGSRALRAPVAPALRSRRGEAARAAGRPRSALVRGGLARGGGVADRLAP
jgi:hypothetical protein